MKLYPVVVQRQPVLYALTTDEVIPSGGTKTTSTLCPYNRWSYTQWWYKDNQYSMPLQPMKLYPVVVQRQPVLYALTTDEVIPSGGTKTTSTLCPYNRWSYTQWWYKDNQYSMPLQPMKLYPVVVQRQPVLYVLTANEVIPSQQSCQPQLDLSNKGMAHWIHECTELNKFQFHRHISLGKLYVVQLTATSQDMNSTLYNKNASEYEHGLTLSFRDGGWIWPEY